MSLTSFPFIMFFAIVYIFNVCYVNLSKKRQYKSISAYSIILLIESYLFLFLSDIRTTICVFCLTLVCWTCSVFIKRENRYSKKFLITGIVFAIGQLCIFKYYGFAAEIVRGITGYQYELPIYFSILGISFFTFSAISFLVDTYKKKAECNLIELALYLAFFPKFLSGPIVRMDHFKKQLFAGIKNINIDNLQVGIQLVVIGVFKKMVIADHLAIFVDDVYLAPEAFSSFTCIWAVVSYALQIYFDFSGYSDMAIGFSRMLGIKIDKNFDIPYVSRNVTEFWKRWHISLSKWLQEYLYIPLGGNRKGKTRQYINLIITMAIGGMWHGASITFVIWGLMHGIALIIHKMYMQIVSVKQTKVTNYIAVITTFVFISITWIFFRADSFQNAFDMIYQLFAFADGIEQIYSWTWLAIAFAIWEVIYSYKHTENDEKISIKYPILALDSIKNLMIFFIFIGITIILAYVGNTAFIYGKF